jgi:hypothetical protein
METEGSHAAGIRSVRYPTDSGGIDRYRSTMTVSLTRLAAWSNDAQLD